MIVVGRGVQVRTEALPDEPWVHAIEHAQRALCHHLLKVERFRRPCANSMRHRQQCDICQRQSVKRRSKGGSDARRNRGQTGKLPEDVDESYYGTKHADSGCKSSRDFEHPGGGFTLPLAVPYLVLERRLQFVVVLRVHRQQQSFPEETVSHAIDVRFDCEYAPNPDDPRIPNDFLDQFFPVWGIGP